MKLLERRAVRRRPSPDPGNVPDWNPSWVLLLPGLLIALQFALAAVASTGVRFGLGGVLVLTGLADAIVVGIAAFRLCVVPQLPAASLGLRPPALTRDYVVLPAAGLVLSYSGVLLVDAAYAALSGRPPPPQSAVQLLSGVESPGLRLLAFAVVGVVAPVCEEILFRGVVFRILWKRMGLPAGMLLSAALFSAAHLDLTHAAQLAVVGVVLAWLASRSGSLYPGMILHGLINSAALLSTW